MLNYSRDKSKGTSRSGEGGGGGRDVIPGSVLLLGGCGRVVRR